MFDRLERHFIALLRKFADSLGRNAFAMEIARRRMRLDPRHHGRTGGQRFPAAPKSARTLGARGIDHVMSNLRMSAVDAAVKFPVENHSSADSGADRHINQAEEWFSTRSEEHTSEL